VRPGRVGDGRWKLNAPFKKRKPMVYLNETDLKHTPGPWEYRRLRDSNGQPYATLYQCHVDLRVCMIWAPPGNVEQEANARLISASPDLLAALMRVQNDLISEYGPLVYQANFAYIDEAISKATRSD